MSALVNWIMQDIRSDVLMALDPRVMTKKEATALILLSALAWLLLEGVVHVLLRPWLYGLLYPVGAPLHSKGQRQASKDVTTAAVNLVSIVHVFVAVPIAVRVLLDPEVYSDTIYGHTQLSVLMCVISSGYFLHDLIIVLLRLDTEGMAMLIHACCCLFVYTYAVYSFYLTFYGAGFLLWELSTPFVHLRWLLHKSGREKSRAYVVNALVMMVVFFLCRPVWGTWLSYKFFIDTEVELRHPRPNGFPASGIWGYRIANVSLNLLNYWWFFKIARKAMQLRSPAKPRSKARKSS